MELKFGEDHPLVAQYKSFNRTFMELKFDFEELTKFILRF